MIASPCDTIPPPRFPPKPLFGSNSMRKTSSPSPKLSSSPTLSSASIPARKLCVRHQRMADEGTNGKLQQSLDMLPVKEREAVNAIWSNFSSSSHPCRAIILQGLLTMCCFSQLSLLTDQLSHLIRIDPFSVLPREVGLKVLGYLDATSLCRAAQVNTTWKGLADDDILWRGICEQHIGQKCRKCGWGLPVLEKRRNYRPLSPSPSPTLTSKRQLEDPCSSDRTSKRLCRDAPDADALLPQFDSDPHSLVAPNPSYMIPSSVTRPWKSVYSERLTIERNWRRGRCTVRTLQGHTDGVMCLQFSETLSHPSFPVLITGSYDRTARVWNLDTGKEIHILKGHTRAIRALQFDDCKLITGSMDHTLKVWDWRTGRCVTTLTGHTDGVVCLNFDNNVLASGGADRTIRVWNLREGGCFTLRGHQDWVNALQLWDSKPNQRASETTSMSTMDSSLFDSSSNQPSQIDLGKMLFSGSDDGSIRLWDLTLRTCVRQFSGHNGQVQSMKLLLDKCEEEEDSAEAQAQAAAVPSDHPGYDTIVSPVSVPSFSNERPAEDPQRPPGTGPSHPRLARNNSTMDATTFLEPPTKRTLPVLISGSLDNTIKMWDIETGKPVKTMFGHIEGVWAVASDKLRLVSGSHDRTIKVWNREEGKCTATLVGHKGAVTCLSLGEDKIVSGSDDGAIKLWSFAGPQ